MIPSGYYYCPVDDEMMVVYPNGTHDVLWPDGEWALCLYSTSDCCSFFDGIQFMGPL